MLMDVSEPRSSDNVAFVANIYQNLPGPVGLLLSRDAIGALTKTQRLAKMAVVRREM